MAEDVRVPFVMDVKSVRILTAEEAAAEREAARDVPLGPHDVILPIKGAENLRTSPGLQEEIKRAQRAFDRRQAAEASRAVLAREARRRYIPPGTPPLLRKLYRNMLPSPNDPRPEDLTPDDATPDDETPDDAPDRSGLTATQGLRSRYPRLFRSQQAATASADDDPPQAALSQDAATPGDVSDADASPPPQTPAPMTDTTANAAADDDDVALLASIDPLSHVTPASTHDLVQYASNDRVQFDASTNAQEKSPQQTPQAASSHEKTGAEQKSQDKSGTAQTELDNERDLSRLIFSEANGRGYDTMVAVGWAVRNRMRRDGKTKVSDVWGHHAFAHGKKTNGDSDKAAKAVLSGKPDDDPTKGATHFYSPNGMPLYEPPPPNVSAKDWQKKQQATYKNYDIGGGPDDRVGADGELHYRPSFANSKDFESVRPVKGVDDGYFRFYRQKGSGPVDPHSHAHRHVSGHHGKMVIREKPRIT